MIISLRTHDSSRSKTAIHNIQTLERVARPTRQKLFDSWNGRRAQSIVTEIQLNELIPTGDDSLREVFLKALPLNKMKS
jgi:hypothetical protein